MSGGGPPPVAARPTGDADVVDRPGEHRYELRADGRVVGAAVYRRLGDRVVFTHTEVPESVGGRGLGSRLVRAALDDVRQQGAHVVPRCPFVAGWIRRHPDYSDLVAAPDRSLLEDGDPPTA